MRCSNSTRPGQVTLTHATLNTAPSPPQPPHRFGNSGNAMLVGVGGSGKQSLARLAAHICGYEVFQIAVSSTYGVADFKEALLGLYTKTGAKVGGWYLCCVGATETAAACKRVEEAVCDMQLACISQRFCQPFSLAVDTIHALPKTKTTPRASPRCSS